MHKLIFVTVMTASFLLYLHLDAVITFAASESEPAVFRPSPHSTPSLNPSVSYHVYDKRYNPFISEIDEAVRNVLKYNWMLPSPLVIELGRPIFQCPQGVVAYFCGDNERGYSYINFMPATFEGNIAYRYDIYYHELGHAVAESLGILLQGEPCITENSYGQFQPWTCQWNEGFAEFFSAMMARRSRSLFLVESTESPAYVANVMLQKVQEIEWDFFLCVYDKARNTIYSGYWTRYKWDLAVQECAGPLLEASLVTPATVRASSVFEVSFIVRVLQPLRAIQVMLDIPSTFQVIYGETRFGWLSPQVGAIFKVSTTLNTLAPGTFTLKANITSVTDLGAQRPFVVETTVMVLPREEPQPPPPPPPSGGVVTYIEATATRVVPGQEIIVRARVTNNGTSFVTIPMPFTVDGKPIMTSNLSIAPGKTETLEFKISFSSDQTGTHTLVVGNSLPITIYVEGPGSSKTPEQFFDSNANGRLDDLEILTALDYWIKQRSVPDIGTLSDLQVLALLDKWIKGVRIAGR